MNIVLALSHSIEEHDQVRLLSSLGHNVFSIGGYIDPAHPHDSKRPALPDVPFFPDLKAAVDSLGTPDNLGAAQAHIPDAILDWADVLIYHHYLDRRLFPQWDRVKHKRVIWRTVGQSVEHNERLAAPYRAEGLQIVRYSPKERNIPGYAGEDALIRFYKDPADYGGWTGEGEYVLGFGQHYVQRGQWTNYPWFAEMTKGLPTRIVGPGSEVVGGPGELTFDELRDELRRARVYLYTGTQPASYTLGLIEAMMTGTPVVSMGPERFDIFPGHDTFEGHELTNRFHPESPWGRMLREEQRHSLEVLLDEPESAAFIGGQQRRWAIDTFGMATVGAEWKAFLG